jgi:hypothetical protein
LASGAKSAGCDGLVLGRVSGQNLYPELRVLGMTGYSNELEKNEKKDIKKVVLNNYHQTENKKDDLGSKLKNPSTPSTPVTENLNPLSSNVSSGDGLGEQPVTTQHNPSPNGQKLSLLAS